jgi:hypothetical protein
MGKEYHYLVAGLPDLLIDDSKLPITVNEFRGFLAESLDPDDFNLIRLYFYRYDNQNVLSRLKDPEAEFDNRSNLSESDLDEILQGVKDGSVNIASLGAPRYFQTFIEAFWSDDTKLFEGKPRDLELSELYYAYICSVNNPFIAKWFCFERDLQNIITASQCRKYDTPVENQLVGSGEFIEKLIRSNARDFGIDSEFPMRDKILKAIDDEDIREFEKKIDLVKWEFLDDEEFFYYFTVEKLFSFLIKLSIVERWMALDKETGRRLFNEMLKKMEAGYVFPDEFKTKNK